MFDKLLNEKNRYILFNLLFSLILIGVFLLLIAILTSFLTKTYILTIGFALFIISDVFVSISRFARPIKKQHFYIMVTYILAQTLICLSFIYGV